VNGEKYWEKVKEDIECRQRKKNNLSVQANYEISPSKEQSKPCQSKERQQQFIERLSKPKMKQSISTIDIMVAI
jgi:hypothetical protein